MKTKWIALLLSMTANVSAVAAPVQSLTLPGGPLIMQFEGNEQIGIFGATTYADADHSGEINWGVLIVTELNVGHVIVEHQSTGAGPGTIFVNKSSHNAQITGMLYDVKAGTPNANDPFPATGGYIDLYWRDLNDYAETVHADMAPAIRCGWKCATGYTQGAFLGRIKFASGADTLNSENFIAGTFEATPTGFAGLAVSFDTVDTTAGGAWASSLNTDWFDAPFGTRDMKFTSSFEQNGNWNAGGPVPVGLVLGASFGGAAEANTIGPAVFAVPEPGILSLFGLALAGTGIARRRTKP